MEIIKNLSVLNNITQHNLQGLNIIHYENTKLGVHTILTQQEIYNRFYNPFDESEAICSEHYTSTKSETNLMEILEWFKQINYISLSWENYSECKYINFTSGYTVQIQFLQEFKRTVIQLISGNEIIETRVIV